MRFKYFLLITLAFISTNAIGKDEQAIEKLRSAFRACEKGLKMKMPKSRGSLKILQNHFNSYQRNRDSALQIDDTLKESKSEYYTGPLFSKKTFAEAYTECEQNLAQKVTNANTEVSETTQEIEAKQQQQQAELKKNEEAKQQVVLAINEYCANYALNPKGASSSLHNNYQTAKQKAMKIYPDIIKEYYVATFKNPTNGGEDNRFNKSVKEWFDYCDKVFAGQKEKLLTTPIPPNNSPPPEEGPTPPTVSQDKGKVLAHPPTSDTSTPAKTSSPAPSKTEESVTEERTDDDKSEYQNVMNRMKGDRLKILKEEGRLPDFVNDEDYDYQKATIWQFEKDSGNKCSIYNFKEEQLVKTQKDLKGECPPF